VWFCTSSFKLSIVWIRKSVWFHLVYYFNFLNFQRPLTSVFNRRRPTSILCVNSCVILVVDSGE
jgi:hypothetical protein